MPSSFLPRPGTSRTRPNMLTPPPDPALIRQERFQNLRKRLPGAGVTAVMALAAWLAVAAGVTWAPSERRPVFSGSGGGLGAAPARTGTVPSPSLPYLGVTYLPLTPPIVARYRLAVTEGALVTAVTGGSPADRAGILPDDVVVELGGTPIDAACSLFEILYYQTSGEPVTIVVVRGGVRVTTRAVLGAQD